MMPYGDLNHGISAMYARENIRASFMKTFCRELLCESLDPHAENYRIKLLDLKP